MSNRRANSYLSDISDVIGAHLALHWQSVRLTDIKERMYYRKSLQMPPVVRNRNTLNISHLFYCVTYSQNIMLPAKLSPRNNTWINMQTSGNKTRIIL